MHNVACDEPCPAEKVYISGSLHNFLNFKKRRHNSFNNLLSCMYFKGCPCSIKWRKSSVCYYGGLRIEVTRKRSISVTYEKSTLTILRHRASGTLFLGFYVQDQSSLGYHAKGLIGTL